MPSNYTSNPEINRNIWLELTFGRLAGIPLVIICFLGLAYLTAVRFFDANFAEIINTSSLYGLYLTAFVMGVRQASGAIIKEVHEKTWDAQRLLSIAPKTMMLGKLFGSTIYAWYGVACFGVLYLGSALLIDHTFERIALFVTLLLGAIMVQALIISLTVLKINKDRSATISTFFYFVIGVVVALFVIDSANKIVDFEEPLFFWYTLTLPVVPALLAVTALFTGWSVYGLYRTLRREYLYTNTIIPWSLFTVTLMIFVGGLYSAEHVSSLTEGLINFDQIAVSTHTAFIVGVILSYYLAFSESRSVITFNSFLWAVSKKRVSALLTQTPLWVVTLCITAGAAVVSVVFSVGSFDTLENRLGVNALWAINILAFVIRDITLLHLVSFVEKKRKPEGVTLFYLILMYGMVPALFGVVGLKDLLPVFLPMTESGIVLGTLFPWGQTIGIVVFTHKILKNEVRAVK